MKPLVTVICITHNHERYIVQALESFVNQQTSFPFKVLVGDDASTDHTPGIVQAYAERHPGRIVAVLREHNIGGGRNWQDLIARTHTPYIAFCDGDDYWKDPLKLQKQFAYMESHADMRACFHDVEISVETSDGTWFQSKDFSHTKDGRLLWPSGNVRFFKKRSYRLENYIPFGFVHTSSMFIRWDYHIGFPDWIPGHGFSDFPMWAVQINTGRFGYLDEIMSVYRRTGTGTFSFDSRYDFWRKSKAGSIEIDEELTEFFSTTKPSRSILKAIRSRESDDLAKLIKGSIECDDERSTWNLLVAYRHLIEKLYGVAFDQSYSPQSYRKAIERISSAAPLPPYNQTTSAKLKRMSDMAFTAIRTLI